MPAKKTTRPSKAKAVEPKVETVTAPPVQAEAPVQPAAAALVVPVEAPPAQPQPTQPATTETPAPSVAPTQPATAPAPAAVAPAAPPKIEVKEDVPNMDGWVAVNEILPQGQSIKNSFKAGTCVIVGLLFGLAIGAGGMWWWDSKAKPAVSSQTNSLVKNMKGGTALSPTGVAAASNSASVATNGVSRKDISLQIQNGSGVKGAAATAADLLQALGYQVVGTGNAKGGPFTESKLQVKKTKDGVTKMLQEDLGADYQLAKTVEVLEETATYDAVFIVGKK